MSESLGVIGVAKRSVQALDDGQISQETFALLQKRLACEQFPNDSEGVALAKFYATPHGAEMLNRGLKKNYQVTQLRGALSNTAAANILKAFGNPASRQSEYETPPHPEADEMPHATGEVAEPEPFDQKVERLMREKNISRDAAITLIYRAEKISKGVRW